jgi:hypothetical protein
MAGGLWRCAGLKVKGVGKTALSLGGKGSETVT